MIFLDTTYLVALLIDNDQYKERATEILENLKEKTIINNTVLCETINFLSKCKQTKDKKTILNIIDIIKNTNEIHYLTEKEYNESMELYVHYNTAINYSDCTILKTLEKYNINQIISFDSDFDKVKGIIRKH